MERHNCDIVLGYGCNNNCIHCVRGGKNRSSNFSFDEIKKLVLDAKSRDVTRIILQGGEPTIRPDFLDIIDLIKKTDIPEIQIQTNGRMFSYLDFAKEVSAKGIAEFCFSFHTDVCSDFDNFTRSKGSFNQSVQGIKNLVHLNQNIKILLIITKQNYKRLKFMLEFLVNLGIKLFQIGIINPVGNAKRNFNSIVPSLKEIRPYLLNGLEYLDGLSDVSFYTQEIPKCIVGIYKSHVLEDYLPTKAEKLYMEENVYDHESLRKSWKSKSLICSKCKETKFCEGVYTDYLNAFGDDDLEPIN
jgi:MoaA/NifB/PqqE/SkfB family radical SAM enzyme